MLESLSTLLHGTLHEKLIWTFRVYDLNGDGVITKNELGNVVVAVYELMGIIIMPPVSKLCISSSSSVYYSNTVVTKIGCDRVTM